MQTSVLAAPYWPDTSAEPVYAGMRKSNCTVAMRRFRAVLRWGKSQKWQKLWCLIPHAYGSNAADTTLESHYNVLYPAFASAAPT